ncbi:toxin-antitoxin system YwqK family antitoxin [Flammeovirga agarivorans]|uniref:Antitoxin component YwqK of the YwqJK toxin-antitoxin module n=1 Tax=Flammeovirga agarivorans TaxID=2726742 RepID=A0A7X8SMQ0_9BACT|nr:hypothetical protein [Flammeovirga agarivorans]NLR93045.1 hypothetical protein [Flammeovirga agarivorans]
MTSLVKYITFFLITIYSSAVLGQSLEEEEDKPKVNKPMVVEMDSLEEDAPTIELNPGAPEEVETIKKKKKKKKNVFWGIKAKRAYTRSLSKGNQVFELFYTLPEYEAPNEYSPLKYFYNPKERKIEKKSVSRKEYGLPLHGTYIKIVEKDTVTVGQFYKGLITGRWVWYGKDKQIKDKKFYYMGFPKESKITYYDSKQTKVKEVVPIQYDEKNGIYQEFYESGLKKTVGAYKFGYKIGDWTEYFDAKDKRGRQRKKRITQYRNKNNVYRKDYNGPKIKYEWDEKGKVLIKNK